MGPLRLQQRVHFSGVAAMLSTFCSSGKCTAAGAGAAAAASYSIATDEG